MTFPCLTNSVPCIWRWPSRSFQSQCNFFEWQPLILMPEIKERKILCSSVTLTILDISIAESQAKVKYNFPSSSLHLFCSTTTFQVIQADWDFLNTLYIFYLRTSSLCLTITTAFLQEREFIWIIFTSFIVILGLFHYGNQIFILASKRMLIYEWEAIYIT